MDEYDDIDVAPVFLPGIDLALWMRIILMVVVTIAAATAVGLSV